MKIREVLSRKGGRVVTVPPRTSVVHAVQRMRAEGIGSLVVSADGQRIDGVVSERDIVLAFARFGPELSEREVREVMRREVPVCAPDETLRRVMAQMTARRMRHIPVVEDGRVTGLVSIGDLVKHQLEELEQEVGVLRTAYLARS